MKKIYLLLISLLFLGALYAQDYHAVISGNLEEYNVNKGDMSGYLVYAKSNSGAYAEAYTNSAGEFKIDLYGKTLPDTVSLEAINKCGQTEYGGEYYIHQDTTISDAIVYSYCSNDTVDVYIVAEQNWEDPQSYTFDAQIKGQGIDFGNLSYYWYYDNTDNTNKSFSYTFPVADTCYEISLTISDGQNSYYANKTVCTTSPIPQDVSCLVTVMGYPDPNDASTFTFYPFPWAKSGLAPISATWDFGDGSSQDVSSSDLGNPVTHTYAKDGVYNVTVTYDFSDGLSSTCTATGSTYAWTGTETWYPEDPQALFFSTPDPDDPLTINLINISVAPKGNMTGYLWDFGDGTTSTYPNPTHTYDKAGLYNISLTLYTNDGSNTFTQLTQVGQDLSPVLFYPHMNGAKSISVTFKNITTSDDDDEWEWDVGDALKKSSAKATGDSITVEFPSTGVYTVGLIGNNTLTKRTMIVDIVDVDSFKVLSSTLSQLEYNYLAPVTEISKDRQVVIYPVPTNDLLNLAIGETANNVKVAIFNTTGQKVYTNNLGNGNKFYINVSTLPKGIYFLKVEYNDKVSLLKFIK